MFPPHDVKCQDAIESPSLPRHKWEFCVLVAPLSSSSPQEEKQGLQKVVPSEGSSTKNTLSQDEWGNSPANTFWVYVFIVLFNC
jgi:hypothetical protein